MLAAQLSEDQRTEEWFTQRLGRATASRFGDIMSETRGKTEAASRKNYRAQLVAERLTGVKEEMWTTKEMQWGIDYEPVAKLSYELKTGLTVTDCGFYKHELIEAGASPDGLVEDLGVLEIKCPNTATHIETLRKQSVPYKYFWQVMGQMWITGRAFCDFVSFDPRMPEGAQLVIIRVERDEEYIRQLEDAVRTFMLEVDREEQFIRNYIKQG